MMIEYSLQQKAKNFHLRPFGFYRVSPNSEMLINPEGKSYTVPAGTCEMILKKEVDSRTNAALYAYLLGRNFISEEAENPN